MKTAELRFAGQTGIFFEPMSGDAAWKREEVTIEGMCLSANDGDGIIIENDGRAYKVRLAGVDVPELYASDEKSRIMARAARGWLATMCVGKVCRVYRDPIQQTMDRFGRVVGYVERVEDGADICFMMIVEGVARAWRERGYSRRPVFQAIKSRVGRLSGVSYKGATPSERTGFE